MLDLSPKEKAVIAVLRNIGKASKISDISRSADLPHATASFILRKLARRKIAARIRYDNHFRWIYQPTLDLIDPGFSQESKPFTATISGMQSILAEFIKTKELNPSERIYCIQGAGITKTILKKIDRGFIMGFHGLIKKRRMIIEGVIARSVLDLFKDMDSAQQESHLGRLTVTYILPDEFLDFPMDIFMFNGHVLLVNYESEKLVRIDDVAAFQAFKSLFRLAEQNGKKIDLNAYIEGLMNKETS